MRRGIAVLAAGLAILTAPGTAFSADLFTIAGGGDEPLREGVMAGLTTIDTVWMDVAADPLGGYAFTAAGRIWRVGPDGRVRRVRMQGAPDRIVFSPDGALYAGNGNAVFRVTPDGRTTIAAGRPDEPGSGGDGGPAVAARLTVPEPLTFDRSGGLLIADQGRVRRLAADGTITTVARIAPDRPAGEPGPAAVRDVAVDADGSLLVAGEEAVMRVAGDVMTRVGPGVERLAVLTDGTVVGTTGYAERADGWVERLTPPTLPLYRRADLLAFDVWEGSDALGNDSAIIDALEPLPGGGLLIAAESAVHYAPGPTAGLPAIAVTEARQTGRSRVRVTLRSTVTGTARIRLKRNGRVVARADVALTAPRTTVRLHARVEPSIHAVSAEWHPVPGTGAGGAAGAAMALLAPALPQRVARDLVETQAMFLLAYEDLQLDLQPCRRVSSRRVDCPALTSGDCAGVLSMIWERDGHLTWSVYGARRGACRVEPDRGVDPDARRRTRMKVIRGEPGAEPRAAARPR